MFDNVHSLLFHSNMKVVLSAVYSACSGEKVVQDGMYSDLCKS